MQGTITTADITVTFVVMEEAGMGSVAVQDGLSGKQYFKAGLTRAQIIASLIVMLDGDEHELGKETYILAESVQPADPELRFIP